MHNQMKRLFGIFFTVAAMGASAFLVAQPAPPTEIEKAQAFVEYVFSNLEVVQYEEAAAQYLWILRQIDTPVTTKERAIILDHLRLLSLIMTPAARARLRMDDIIEGKNVPAGTGNALIYWWRQQDPLPATLQNERLEEHLSRIMFARRKYIDPNDIRGFDDRGEIYLRLGKPFRQKSISLYSYSLIRPYTVRLPDNEFWVYTHVHDQAHYLFLQRTKKQPFTLGYAIDLLPTELRNGRRKTDLLLATVEEIYAQLALEHPEYGRVYDTVNNYLTLPPYGAASPYQFAQSTLEQAEADEEQHYWSRQKIVPVVFSNVWDNVGTLQPALRWARFLTSEGTTRTELYWSLEHRDLRPRRRLVNALKKEGHKPSKQYLLSMSVAKKSSDYTTQYIDSKRYLVAVDREGTVAPMTFAVEGDSVLFHLGIQWSQQWTKKATGEELLPGAMLKIGVQTIDSLATLNNEGHALEMSDIKPLVFSGGTYTPYPFARLSFDTPLSLYFELYHLTFGSDDRTQYTIEYSVASSKQDKRISISSKYRGDSRTAREYITLDLSTWDTSGPLYIILRATDDVLKTSVERRITFEYSH